MKVGSLFTGTGALDMAAAEVFGAEPVWFAEYEPPTKKNSNPAQAAARLLAYRYPHVPNLRDITTVDWGLVRLLGPVDLVTAGWPCQPFSLAGKRKGAEDARALWPEVDRCLRALRPRYVLLENVPAVIGAELGRVASTLAALGYRFAWVCLPASAVGAPHRRERFFLLAAAAASGEAPCRWTRADADGRGEAAVADAVGECEGAVAARDRCGQSEEPVGDGCSSVADSARDGRGEGRAESAGQLGRPDVAERCAPAADADRAREPQPEGHQLDGWRRLGHDSQQPSVDWAGYAPAIRRWEAVLGRPAPVPTVRGARGGQVLNPALPEWMMGLPDGWITDVPGLTRAQQLKLAGNGVVPRQAVAAYRYLCDQLSGRS